MGKHLDFYTQAMQGERMVTDGLCGAVGKKLIDKKIFGRFTPTGADLEALLSEGLIPDYGLQSFWACGIDKSENWIKRGYAFTPLRQTIVLFMAAINNEL